MRLARSRTWGKHRFSSKRARRITSSNAQQGRSPGTGNGPDRQRHLRSPRRHRLRAIIRKSGEQREDFDRNCISREHRNRARAGHAAWREPEQHQRCPSDRGRVRPRLSSRTIQWMPQKLRRSDSASLPARLSHRPTMAAAAATAGNRFAKQKAPHRAGLFYYYAANAFISL